MVTENHAKQTQFAFSMDSEMWRINHQKCGLFFGPAAAILQIAHPRIAQGVADHSQFESDSLGRLQRTLLSTNRIAFGSLEEAREMKQRLAKVHASVRGEVSESMAGPNHYSAFEPELLLWVTATMIEAALQGYEMVSGELPAKRKEQFYQEMLEFGTYFGLAGDAGPASYMEFKHYYDDMLNGELLGSHPLCSQLAQAIALPQDSAWAKLLGRRLYFLAVEGLPSPVREKLGFRSSRYTRSSMWALRRSVRLGFGLLPPQVRLYPEALARVRLEKSE